MSVSLDDLYAKRDAAWQAYREAEAKADELNARLRQFPFSAIVPVFQGQNEMVGAMHNFIAAYRAVWEAERGQT